MTAQESHALVLENMGWARKHALKVAHELGIRLEGSDCEQEGMCALVNAAAKWTGNGDFRAWAYKFIRDHLTDVRRHQSRIAVEYASAGVIEALDRQDRDEELSWARHINCRGWSPCEQDRLSYTPSLGDDD